MRKDNGLAYTIKYYKAVKLHITRYMCHKPLMCNNANVSVSKDGFPTRFEFLRPLVKENPKALLTLLSFTRSVEPQKNEKAARVVNLSTITAPYKGIEYTIPKAFIKSFIDKYDLSSSKHEYSAKDHYLSIKGSPNGKASVSSLWSSAAHNSNTLEYLRYLSGDYFKVIMDNYINLKINHRDLLEIHAKKNILGKLAIVHDPELKERVIAMVDYTTQFILKPIHDNLLSKLSNLPCDRTFNQDPFHTWSNDQESFHSLDLSAATDRFPISLQQKLISLMYNDYAFGENWKNLLVDRTYWYESTEYKYSVGQPMGAYTSWAAFTLTHHLVVAWAAHKAGLDNFKDYIILGDDIVIKNNRVAQIYIALMTRWGVDISHAKTHVSRDTYEFAKRWIQNGREITGLSLRGILINIKHVHVVYMNLFNYINRVPYLDINLLDAMGSIYKGLIIGKRVKSSNSIIKQLYDFHHSIRYSFGLISYQELRNYLIVKFPIDEYTPWSEKLIHSKLNEILSTGVVKQAKVFTTKLLKQSFKLEDATNNKDLLKSWPLSMGFVNHIDNLRDIMESYIGKSFDLLDIISKFRLQSLDGILKTKRNSFENLILLDKLWRESFREYYKVLKLEVKENTIVQDENPIDDNSWLLELKPNNTPWSPPKMNSFEKHVMSSFWKPGTSQFQNPINAVYKTTHVGFDRWEDKLLKDITNLKTDLNLLLNSETKLRDKEPLTTRIQNYILECKRSGKVPDFEQFSTYNWDTDQER